MSSIAAHISIIYLSATMVRVALLRRSQLRLPVSYQPRISYPKMPANHLSQFTCYQRHPIRPNFGERYDNLIKIEPWSSCIYTPQYLAPSKKILCQDRKGLTCIQVSLGFDSTIYRTRFCICSL